MIEAPLPLLGFAAWSGSGKTTLLRGLIPLLCARGLRVGMIKQTHHDFELDQPGKDSYELRKAGAAQTLLASRHRWALIGERDPAVEPTLAELIARLDCAALDLILVEGFKHEPFPKIEVHRPALGRPPLYPDDQHIIAVASDAPLELGRPLPLLDLNQGAAVAEFVFNFCRRGGGPQPETESP